MFEGIDLVLFSGPERGSRPHGGTAQQFFRSPAHVRSRQVVRVEVTSMACSSPAGQPITKGQQLPLLISTRTFRNEFKCFALKIGNLTLEGPESPLRPYSIL